MSRNVVHLFDDKKAGGVARMLDFLAGADFGEAGLTQERHFLKRGTWRVPRLPADVVVTHVATSLANLPTAIFLRARNPQTRMIHVEHSYSAAFEALNVPNQDRFRSVLRTFYALFDVVVAVSRGQANWLLAADLVDPERLAIIPPCVDLQPFLAASASDGADYFRLGFVGRLHPQKGVERLVDAMRLTRRRDIVLEIHGDGPLGDTLRTKAAGDPRIRFAGFAADPASAMAGCDAVVVPSLWEPYGLVCQEAHAAGRQVVMANVDGLPEQAIAGDHVVDSIDPAAWADVFDAMATFRPKPAANRVGQATLAMSGFVGSWQSILTGSGPHAPAVSTAQSNDAQASAMA